MKSLHHLLTPENAQAAIAASESQPIFIFKNSPICEFSAIAIVEFENFRASEPAGFEFYQVDVIHARSASMQLEASTGIRHESPQVLMLWKSKCVFHASHRGIRAGTLKLQADAVRTQISLPAAPLSN